jgi:hypothetical protein
LSARPCAAYPGCMLRLPATLAFVVLTACGGDPVVGDAAVADAALPDAVPPDANLCIFGCAPEDDDAGIECPVCTDKSAFCPVGCYVT